MDGVRVAGLILGLCAAGVTAARAAPADESDEPESLAMTLHEAAGPGRPLWRRWVDLDADGDLDLVVMSGSSTVPQPDTARVEPLLAWLTVTPSFLDRKEVLLYRQTPEGLAPWGAPLVLPGDTSAVDLADIEGDGTQEILFAAGYRVYALDRPAGSDTWSPEPITVLDAEMLLGTSRAFVPGAALTANILTGAPPSLLLATVSGVELRHREPDGSYPAAKGLRLRAPLRRISMSGNSVSVFQPLPRVVDADGDGTIDLLFRADDLLVYRGRGDGSFDAQPVRAPLTIGPEGGRRSRATLIEDIDGDGILDIVSVPVESPADEPPAKENGKEKKREKGERETYEIRLGHPGLVFSDPPDTVAEVTSHEKLGGATAEFARIDADARQDLVVARYSTSFWQIARVLMTKKIGIDVSFESMLQRPDGSFAPATGKPFETRVVIDLKRGISGMPSEPRGDFNGDGITDLLLFDGEPSARVHLTSSEGTFARKPSVVVPLQRSPEDRALVDVEDVNGDGRSDIAFFTAEGDGFVVSLLRSARP